MPEGLGEVFGMIAEAWVIAVARKWPLLVAVWLATESKLEAKAKVTQLQEELKWEQESSLG